jgi:hypothetical protein
MHGRGEFKASQVPVRVLRRQKRSFSVPARGPGQALPSARTSCPGCRPELRRRESVSRPAAKVNHQYRFPANRYLYAPSAEIPLAPLVKKVSIWISFPPFPNRKPPISHPVSLRFPYGFHTEIPSLKYKAEFPPFSKGGGGDFILLSGN